MQTHLRNRDLISDLDLSKEEVETVLDVAFDLKRQRALGIAHPHLRDKVLAMLFFFSSTRTRGSFEAGMAQLGGHAAFIESKTTQIAHGDTPKEIGEIFGRYFDGIAIRHVDWQVGNGYLNEVAKHSRVPVLNMQCDIYHPFQCLADLMTIVEKKGRNLRRQRMVVSWAYAASYQKPISVPQSLVLQMPRFGLDIVLAHPPEFGLMPEIMDAAREQARRFGTGFEVISDPDGMESAFRDADIVYAKSWGALVETPGPARSPHPIAAAGSTLGKRPAEPSRSEQAELAGQGADIIAKYAHWITDERKMALARPDAIYMHPLPADRNIEVTDGVLDGPQSAVYDEAENRLHAQKAVMALTM